MTATRHPSRSTLLTSTMAIPLLGACNAMPSTTIDGREAKVRMREDFVCNRLTPMYRCAGTDAVPKWPVQATAARSVRS